MPKVLVTGAGGYIGCVLVPMLVGRGYEVRAVDRFFFGDDLLAKDPQVELVKEDTRHLHRDHFRDIEGVVDLAAVSNDPSGECFPTATWEINCDARVRTARLAKEAGARRYVLPSSCSIYGFRGENVVVNESSPTNPLTTYAKANEKAERGVRTLADEEFCVVVVRQATVFGYSPRMRFDLAINGMVYGAWKTGVLPLMRDGSQWRPMVHVQDTAAALCFMLEADREAVNGQIFNVGANSHNYQLGRLAEIVTKALPREVKIEWYGDPDRRSYRVAFDKIEALGFRAKYSAEQGAIEVYEALESRKIDKTIKSITLDWYKELERWHRIIRAVEMYGGILEI